MAQPVVLEKTIGFRLTVADRQKLKLLCEATHRPPGELLRLLIRTAEPTHLPCVKFAVGDEQEACQV